jgi:hypothetical protein
MQRSKAWQVVVIAQQGGVVRIADSYKLAVSPRWMQAGKSRLIRKENARRRVGQPGVVRF